MDPDAEQRGAGSGPTAGHVPRRIAIAAGRGVRAGARRVSAWNRGSGAAESGLARLVETHALQCAGDAFVTVALAGSLFFSVPTHEARTRVALYLIITMAPFAVVAPVLGPLLDRFSHGRRWALALTMIARATLGLVIGHSLDGSEPLALYPAALGVLVGSKAYGIARSATVPRLLPRGMSLVQANSRLTLVGVISPGVAGLVAIGITKVGGHLWALRVGAVVYVLASLCALTLPRHADGGPETRRAERHPALGLREVLRFGQNDIEVAGVLRSTVALRWLAGFLLLYGAFVVREHPLDGLSGNVSLGALAVGIGIGNLAGTWIGARTANTATRRLVVVLLAVTAVATLFAAVDFGTFTVFLVAFVSAASAAVAKLGLDATIQHRVADAVRTSTFARSETTLQLAWVVGGAVGILLPTEPALGFAVATAVLVGALILAIGFAARPHPPAPPAEPAPPPPLAPIMQQSPSETGSRG